MFKKRNQKKKDLLFVNRVKDAPCSFTSSSSERRLKMANGIAVLLAIGTVAFMPAINAFVPARAFVHYKAPNMVRFNTAAVQRKNADVSLRMVLPKRCVQWKNCH